MTLKNVFGALALTGALALAAPAFAQTAPASVAASVVAAEASAAAVAPRMEAHEAASDEFDPAKNKRLLSISEKLRCLVCQNQTIAESNADLAVDLRRQVREQIAAGRSDDEIIRYMTDRYGDFVLYKPPFKASTAILWAGPVILLVLVLGWYIATVRRRKKTSDDLAPLTEEERREALRLLERKPEEGEGK